MISGRDFRLLKRHAVAAKRVHLSSRRTLAYSTEDEALIDELRKAELYDIGPETFDFGMLCGNPTSCPHRRERDDLSDLL